MKDPGLLTKYRKFLFPGTLLLFIVAAAIPLILGGGFITWSTLVTMIETRKITAGLLIVFALIGTTYVSEYLAGAIVAFMVVAGEFLEDITLDRTRNAVRELVQLSPDTAWVNRNGEYISIPVEDVSVGEMVLVKPGERIPVDGTKVQVYPQDFKVINPMLNALLRIHHIPSVLGSVLPYSRKLALLKRYSSLPLDYNILLNNIIEVESPLPLEGNYFGIRVHLLGCPGNQYKN